MKDWTFFNAQSSDQPNQLLCYDGDELIGSAYIQDGTEAEVYSMVHPEHRRKGTGRALLSAVQVEYRKRGRKSLLLVCEDVSASGKAFAEAVDAQYRFSEYGMVLDPMAIDRTRPRHESLHLQPADATDIEALVHIKSVSFGLSIDEV